MLRITKPVICLLLFLMLIVATVTDACADEALDYFKQGVTAARSGDVKTAVRAFETAKRMGMTTNALYYNLGVIYYRMKVYSWSAQYFRLLANDDTYSALANYNLGLIAAHQNNIAQAVYYFRICNGSTNDPKLKALSALAIQRFLPSTNVSNNMLSKNKTGQKDVDPKAKISTWHGIIVTTYGRDNNVGLANDEVKSVTGVSELHDSYFDGLITTHGFFTGNEDGGFSMTGFASLQKYMTTSVNKIYSFRQYHLSFNRETKVAYWNMAYGIGLDRINFGQLDFEHLYSLFIGGKRNFSDTSYIRASYSICKIEANSLYAYLNGARQILGFDYTNLGKDWKYRLGYGLEFNDRQDFSDSTTNTYIYQSFSPIRNALSITGSYTLSTNWQGRAELQYRNSLYRKDDVHVDTSTNTHFKRNDNRYQFIAALTYQVSRNTQAGFEYSYTWNDSNRVDSSGNQLSDYQRNLINVSFSWRY